MSQVKVIPNDDGIRPAGPSDACFYCGSKVGEFHGPECVIVRKRVKVRYTYEIEIDVPRDWDAGMIEFVKNDSSSCADNTLSDLYEACSRLNEQDSCLCNHFKCEVLDMGDGKATQDMYPKPPREAD